MPCGDSNYDCNRTNERVAEELRVATRAGCDMRTILRRNDLEGELCQETLRWIFQHDMEDAKRIAKEEAAGIRQQTRLNGLAKLTMDERRVLGL